MDSQRMPLDRRWLTLCLLLSLGLIGLDQLTKLWVEARFSFAERLPVTSFFDLTLLYNKGAAFSMLASQPGWQRWAFTFIGISAALFILVLLIKNSRQHLFCLALSMIMGGALGNVIDRIAHGHVIDFLLFYYRSWHWPAFNVADSAITVGAALLIIDELVRVRRSK